MGSYRPATATEISDAVQDAAEKARASLTAPRRRPFSPTISVNQAKRFYAIARANGWTELEQSHLLARLGFEMIKSITRDAYDRACSMLENPVVHDEIRKGVA